MVKCMPIRVVQPNNQGQRFEAILKTKTLASIILCQDDSILLEPRVSESVWYRKDPTSDSRSLHKSLGKTKTHHTPRFTPKSRLWKQAACQTLGKHGTFQLSLQEHE